MKKNVRSILVYATALSVSLSACKDQTEEEISNGADKNATPSTEVEIPENFSAFTSEENKTNLEDNGIELAKDMESFQNAKGVSSLSNLATLLMGSSEGARTKEVVSLIKLFKHYHEGKVSTQRTLKAMRSAEDTPEDIGAALELYGGVYEWDSKNQTLKSVEQSKERITIKFPSVANGTSNNAVFTLHSYKGVVVKNKTAAVDAELPTQLKMELTVDKTKEIDYSLVAAYNDKGEPTKAVIVWSINPFNLTSVFENETEEIGFSYAFTKNNNNLISFGAGSQGNFDTEFMAKTFEEDEENVGAVFHNARAYFQLKNVKFAGKMNIKELQAAAPEEDNIESGAALLNEHATFVVYYADNKQKIADTEFYVKTYTDEYQTYEYNEETEDWEMVTKTETYEDIAPRLIFADGSKSDLETYVSEGFDNLEKELEKLSEMFENFM